MRTANPALNKDTFSQGYVMAGSGNMMTIQGVVNKSMILLLMVMITASYVWGRFFAILSEMRSFQDASAAVGPWIIIGALGGFIMAMVTIFKKNAASFSAPLYCLFEGLFLGGISSLVEARYPGMVIQAVALTFGTAFALFAVYKSGLIKVDNNFRLGLAAATGGIFLVYMVSFITGMFGMNSFRFIHEGSRRPKRT